MTAALNLKQRFSYSERARGQSGHEPVFNLHHAGHVHIAAARRVNDVHDLGSPVCRSLQERDTAQDSDKSYQIHSGMRLGV